MKTILTYLKTNVKLLATRNLCYHVSHNERLKPELGLPQKFFITTPIYYLNSTPHIGHLYSNVLADVVSRWYRRVLAVPTQFSTGTDEHGLKVLKAASRHNESVENFCIRLSRQYENLFDLAGIDYTDFIRTTSESHYRTVQDVWVKLHNKGYIKKGSYEGWYSVPDETFVGEDQVEDVEIGGETKKIFIESGHLVEWVKEDNFIFPLSQFTEPLLKWLDSKVIYPEKHIQPLKRWIESGLPDLSVSRQKAKNPWGIPVPGQPSQTVYVWLDALVNYLTVARYPSQNCSWPADCHVVGKDIIKFHAVYWPAFLIALGLELPKKIICHSHWQVNNEKMSKSKGNVIDPVGRISDYSADGLRYYLMKDGSVNSDSNYNDARALECINSDLVNTLGNLLSRSTGKTINPEQIFPPLDVGIFNSLLSSEEKKIFMNLYDLAEKVDAHYRDFTINRALEAIMSHLYAANSLFQNYEPWSLQEDETRCIVYISLETVRVACLALQPVIPQLASKALDRLGIPNLERTWNYMTLPVNVGQNGTKLGENNGPLLQRLAIKN